MTIQEGLTEENNIPCDTRTTSNTEYMNSISKSRWKSYLALSLYLYILTVLISFAFLALLILTVVILILPRYDGTISTAGGQLTHIMEETEIVASTELIAFFEQERFKIQLKSGLHRGNSIRRYHSQASSPVPSEYWNKYGNDCPKFESAAPQPQQTATMCSPSDTQVCPLVQNLPLDHCGSSNKTTSQGQMEVTQFSRASLPLQNRTLNTSVTEEQEVLWFYPVYYMYLISIIIRYMFNTSTLLLLLLLMPILCILSTPAADILDSNYMTNGSLPSDNTGTVRLSPEPPADDNNSMVANEVPSELVQPKESSVSEVSSEEKEEVLPAHLAVEQQQVAPSESGPTESNSVFDHSKHCDQMLNSPIDLVPQSTSCDIPPQGLIEVTSMQSTARDSSSVSTNSNTDVEQSAISESEPDSEDGEIWETHMHTVSSEESEPTDLAGVQKPYLFSPTVEIKGTISVSDSYETTTGMEQPFQQFFLFQENEADPTGLQTEDWNTRLLQEQLYAPERTDMVIPKQ